MELFFSEDIIILFSRPYAVLTDTKKSFKITYVENAVFRNSRDFLTKGMRIFLIKRLQDGLSNMKIRYYLENT